MTQDWPSGKQRPSALAGAWGGELTRDTTRAGVVDDGNIAWPERIIEARRQWIEVPAADPLDELRDRASRTVGLEPNASEAKRRTYARSADLRIYVRRRADGRCEGCGEPRRSSPHGHPYLEPHHTRRLSDGGPDDYHHVIALCPTCHRRVHHAADGESYNDELRMTCFARALERSTAGDLARRRPRAVSPFGGRWLLELAVYRRSGDQYARL